MCDISSEDGPESCGLWGSGFVLVARERQNTTVTTILSRMSARVDQVRQTFFFSDKHVLLRSSCLD